MNIDILKQTENCKSDKKIAEQSTDLPYAMALPEESLPEGTPCTDHANIVPRQDAEASSKLHKEKGNQTYLKYNSPQQVSESNILPNLETPVASLSSLSSPPSRLRSSWRFDVVEACPLTTTHLNASRQRLYVDTRRPRPFYRSSASQTVYRTAEGNNFRTSEQIYHDISNIASYQPRSLQVEHM